MLRVSMSLECNPSTLFSYIHIYMGRGALINTSKIGEASTKINVDISLLEWLMLRSHAAENDLKKINSDPYQGAFMG